MSVDSIKNRIKNNSVKDTSWVEEAKWRKDNEAWLDVSFSIAVKIVSLLRENKKNNNKPSSQKELAEVLGCSAQYVNKLVKGKEKLTIETITKLEQALNISIINPELRKPNYTVVKAKYIEKYERPITNAQRNYQIIQQGVVKTDFKNYKNELSKGDYKEVM